MHARPTPADWRPNPLWTQSLTGCWQRGSRARTLRPPHSYWSQLYTQIHPNGRTSKVARTLPIGPSGAERTASPTGHGGTERLFARYAIRRYAKWRNNHGFPPIAQGSSRKRARDLVPQRPGTRFLSRPPCAAPDAQGNRPAAQCLARVQQPGRARRIASSRRDSLRPRRAPARDAGWQAGGSGRPAAAAPAGNQRPARTAPLTCLPPSPALYELLTARLCLA